MSEKYARREPCGNCPFRRDAPLAYWHPSQYLMLASIKDTEGVATRTFGCHKDRSKPPEAVGMCVGWMLDQRRRGVPSIQLRIELAFNPELAEQFTQATGEADCYDSVDQVVELNLQRDREINPARYPCPNCGAPPIDLGEDTWMQSCDCEEDDDDE